MDHQIVTMPAWRKHAMVGLDRRRLLVGSGAGLGASLGARLGAGLAGGLGTGLMMAPPAFAQDVADKIGAHLAKAEQSGKVAGLHALLVSRRGELVFEHYGQGPDFAWDRPLGNVVFGPDVLHDLRSVSKSVVGLVYGIALADGKVPPPDAKLYEQFPKYLDLAGQPGRERVTMHHVLSMTLGLEWDEFTHPYGDPRNSETGMENAQDRFRFVLDRPVVGEPGAKWTYCGGATALLGRLITRGTGLPLLDYCRKVLFDPLQIGPAEWTKGRDGEPHTASGLRLLPRDLIKIGQLVQAGGAWNGQQIVSADWLKRITTPVVPINQDRSYGYHWYIGNGAPGLSQQARRWVGGIGWGGQNLLTFPEDDLVIVIHCGNYGKPIDQQIGVTRAVIAEVVVPSFI
jgi:CubicO group peptidase (beta-lactamase class C family)